jgi:KaiC/GvpD/RAD55 family RecA-like ATPase
MGRAMQLAEHVFEAVALAADPDNKLPSQRAVLAGAIAEIRAEAVEELRKELKSHARRLVADEIVKCHAELDKLAAKVQAGSHFTEF